MKTFATLIAAAFSSLLSLVPGTASATWIRYLILDDIRSNEPVQLVRQITSGSTWVDSDPIGLSVHFDNFAENFQLVDQGPHSLQFYFDLYRNPQDHSEGPALADVTCVVDCQQSYNFYRPNTDVLLAGLTISQFVDDPVVTVTYLAPPSHALVGGTRIDAPLSLAFANGIFGDLSTGLIPLCSDEPFGCNSTRHLGTADNPTPMFPLGLFIQVVFLPEPQTASLLAVALGLIFVTRRRSPQGAATR